MHNDAVVVVKGGGDLASGVIYRLHRAGFRVVVTEIEQPMTVRRTVAFSDAVYAGEVTVEGVRAKCVGGLQEIEPAWHEGVIPVLVDPQARVVRMLRPRIVVDATMAKRNLGTSIEDAEVVVALGPGFEAGVDAHVVIETNRGHRLGRVIWRGPAEPNTGVPGPVGGYTSERLLRAPCAGVLRAAKAIGDRVQVGEVVCWLGDVPVRSEIAGTLRGLARDGLAVEVGMKIGDVDPRAEREHCFTISDKSLAVGGGVLEAVLYLLRRRATTPAPSD